MKPPTFQPPISYAAERRHLQNLRHEIEMASSRLDDTPASAVLWRRLEMACLAVAGVAREVQTDIIRRDGTRAARADGQIAILDMVANAFHAEHGHPLDFTRCDVAECALARKEMA